MKKTVSLLLLLCCITSFFSCSTDVDLYCDYKDIPIVFGIINVQADTNFIKITKAFCGSNEDPIDATEVALIYDSSNYSEKLDAYILELHSTTGQNYQATGRKFVLDTITVHNKEHGTFYSPEQTFYYTTEHFNNNDEGDKYKYKLVFVKPDGDTVTAVTTPVGGDLRLLSAVMYFQSAPTESMGKISFFSIEEGFLYEISMRFNYREEHPGQPVEYKQISWTYGPHPLSYYEKVQNTENVYNFYYSKNRLFSLLSNAIGSDTIWDENHPNVTRHIDDFVVSITAAGHELYEYYETQQVLENGIVPPSTAYSNINGGFGLFSSRIKKEKKLEFSSSTKLDLFRMPWGFKEE